MPQQRTKIAQWICKGAACDAVDCEGVWCPGLIKEVGDTHAEIHFVRLYLYKGRLTRVAVGLASLV